ncbi:MAG: hypothetical protein AAGF11_40480 [Myxococcota bacterium]
MLRSWTLATTALFTLGCGPSIFVDDDGGLDGGSSSGSSSVSTSPSNPPPPPPSPEPTTGTPDPSTTGIPPDPDDGSTFIVDPTGPPPAFECDLFEQDCPPGFKCSPYSNGGDLSWNATGCFPIVEDPAEIGEPCSMEDHPLSGFDDCGPSAICHGVDEQTLMGTCFGLCIGELVNPSCEIPDQVCVLPSDGVGLCYPSCDPLIQDCPDARACYPVAESFICAPEASPGALGEACEFLNGCAAGLFCAAAEVVPDCPGNQGCCTAFCTLGEPTLPCLPGQTCQPWYEEGVAPPGYEHVGYCALP